MATIVIVWAMNVVVGAQVAIVLAMMSLTAVIAAVVVVVVAGIWTISLSPFPSLSTVPSLTTEI